MNSSRLQIFPFLLVLFEMATYLSSDMFLPALPAVSKDLGISHSEAQLTIMYWFLGSVSVQLILGPLADRFGRKPVLCFGGILFIFSTLLCAFATNLHTLLIARFIQGSGICFMAVPGYASIHECYDQKQAIKIIAFMGGISVLAPALGPLVGSLILLFLNWRWIFGFLFCWALIAVTLLIIWMPETMSVEKRHPLVIKNILKNYFKIITNVNFLKIISVYGLLFSGFITWIVAGPFLVIESFHYSPTVFGLLQGLIFVSFIAASRSVKYFLDWLGLKKLIHLGLGICMLSGVISLILSFLFPTFMFGAIITYIIYAFGSGLIFAPLNRLTIEASNEPMGSRMAVFSTFIGGYLSLGTFWVTLFYDGTLLSLSIILLILSLLGFFLGRFLTE